MGRVFYEKTAPRKVRTHVRLRTFSLTVYLETANDLLVRSFVGLLCPAPRAGRFHVRRAVSHHPPFSFLGALVSVLGFRFCPLVWAWGFVFSCCFWLLGARPSV